MNQATYRDFTRHFYAFARKAAVLAALLSLFAYPAQMVLAAAPCSSPLGPLPTLVLFCIVDDPTPEVWNPNPPPGQYQDLYEDWIQKLVVQPDGKIVAGGFSIINPSNSGDFQVARYNPDGSLDTTNFGTNGYATTGLPVGLNIYTRLGLMDIALQPDGSIVAVGDYVTYIPNSSPPIQSGSSFAVARFNANGYLDTTFGTNGVVITQVGGNGYQASARAVAIQSDGKIVVGGFTVYNSQHKFALARYNATGSLDTTFGTGGMLITTPGKNDDEIHSLLIDGNGKIVVAGHSDNSQYLGVKGTYRFAVARYNTNGSLDTTFGSGGYALNLMGGISTQGNQGRGLAVQPDGKLLVAGSAPVPQIPTNPMPTNLNSQFIVARYNTNGSLDGTFGTAGITQITFDATAHADYAFTVSVDSSGRIIVGGFSYPTLSGVQLYSGGTEEMALARMCPNGQLDTPGLCGPGFGINGQLTGKVALFVGFNDNVQNNNWGDNIYSIVVRPSDGNILAGGSSRDQKYGKRVFTLMLINSGGAASYTISGNVSTGSTPLAGATLSYNNNGPQTATTDGSGNYSITLPGNWTGTIVPSYPSTVFYPGGRAYANLSANQTNQNYNIYGMFLPSISR